jgi:signal transduction histidine kinase
MSSDRSINPSVPPIAGTDIGAGLDSRVEISTSSRPPSGGDATGSSQITRLLALMPFLIVGYLAIATDPSAPAPALLGRVALIVVPALLAWWHVRQVASPGLTALILGLQSLSALALWLIWPPSQGWVVLSWAFGVAGSQLLLRPAIAFAIGGYAAFVATALALPAGRGPTASLLLPTLLLASVFVIGIQRRRQREYLARLESLLAERERYLAELEAAHRQLALEALQTAALAAAEERNRIAREIHDVLAHSLTTIVIQAQALKRLISTDPKSAEEHADTVARLARDGLQEARRSVSALRSEPAEIDGLHLLRNLVSDYGKMTETTTRLEVAGAGAAPSPGVWAALYRITQEALTNAGRHGRARTVDVRLNLDDSLRLRIVDDGAARPGVPVQPGNGLSGMCERVTRLGGSVSFGPRPEGGFQVEVELPR